MSQFGKNVVKFLKAEDGPTTVEYAVMLALIIVVWRHSDRRHGGAG